MAEGENTLLVVHYFWYGVNLIMDDRQACLDNFEECSIRYDSASLLVVFLSVLMGTSTVGQCIPYLESFAMAKRSARELQALIRRRPTIDAFSSAGKKPRGEMGDVEFRDVHFNYPARPTVKARRTSCFWVASQITHIICLHHIQVLQGVSLRVEKGKKVALVGSSGCGKSTCIQLLQRFYDVDSGSVLIDGDDVRDLNVAALRDR